MVAVPASDQECLRCKGGKLLCGLTYCPIVLKIKALSPVKKMLPEMKNEYYGPSPPSLFVGRFGYPKVFVGPMAALDHDNIQIIDEPDQWGTSVTMAEVLNFRAKLLRFMGTEPHKVTDVTSPPKLLELTQEQVQASSPVDLEIKFMKKPKIDLTFTRNIQPMGARVQIDTLQLASTPKIEHKVDRIVQDSDLIAFSAVNELYKAQTTVTQITRILSAGLLGLNRQRRLVPTRWSITAVDDMVGNDLRKQIKDHPPVQDYLVYHNTYLDNDFWVLFIPRDAWFFDYHETWKQKSAWNLTGSMPQILSDTEGPKGRTTYAINTVGGYYAARLAVLEKLRQIRRIASVIVFREVGSGYAIPLGVWQVRENMRTALKNVPDRFEGLRAALRYIESHLTIPMHRYARQSPLLRQKRLTDFFNSSKFQ
ncbi:MAG: hypothetical protein ACFFE8_00380 [Candidatus Heimdallarchaeota archaeon]